MKGFQLLDQKFGSERFNIQEALFSPEDGKTIFSHITMIHIGTSYNTVCLINIKEQNIHRGNYDYFLLVCDAM
jgi:hypothetical protein